MQLRMLQRKLSFLALTRLVWFHHPIGSLERGRGGGAAELGGGGVGCVCVCVCVHASCTPPDFYIALCMLSCVVSELNCVLFTLVACLSLVHTPSSLHS